MNFKQVARLVDNYLVPTVLFTWNSTELWFTATKDRSRFYHLFSIGIAEKDYPERTYKALQIIVGPLSVIASLPPAW